MNRFAQGAATATRLLALLGGVLVLSLALLVTTSVGLRWTGQGSVPGDFEMVQIGLALAVFAYLPWCHWRGANLVVDTFTAAAPRPVRVALDVAWGIMFSVIAFVLGWRLLLGAAGLSDSGTTTMVLGLPVAWSVALSGVACLWLGVVALLVARRTARETA